MIIMNTKTFTMDLSLMGYDMPDAVIEPDPGFWTFNSDKQNQILDQIEESIGWYEVTLVPAPEIGKVLLYLE
jgi:hypothetical protein